MSKFQSVDLIEEAYALGVRNFGENYMQELIEKRRMLSHLADARWHLIGHLQSNKAKQAIQNSDCFHALDSVKLTAELNKRCRELNCTQPWPVFIQVNVDQEHSKSGVHPDQLQQVVQTVRESSNLSLQGLMCIPEQRTDAEQMRPAFKRLAALAKQCGLSNAQLSMGMSEDFAIAIEEGAHWVRVGRRLFGERKTR